MPACSRFRTRGSAAADEVGQRGQCFPDIGVGIGAVDLVDVDVVGLEAAQRVLGCRDDPPPGGTLLVRVGTHGAADLRREDHVVTAALSAWPTTSSELRTRQRC